MTITLEKTAESGERLDRSCKPSWMTLYLILIICVQCYIVYHLKSEVDLYRTREEEKVVETRVTEIECEDYNSEKCCSEPLEPKKLKNQPHSVWKRQVDNNGTCPPGCIPKKRRRIGYAGRQDESRVVSSSTPGYTGSTYYPYTDYSQSGTNHYGNNYGNNYGNGGGYSSWYSYGYPSSSGYSDYSGYPSTNGYPGYGWASFAYPGTVGSPGYTGYTGDTGWSGSPGWTGSPGWPGASGMPGEPGMAGDPGGAGMPGEPGWPGGAGLAGMPGRPGGRGPAGQPGMPGMPGGAGMPGAPGGRGMPGGAGAPGMPGGAGAPGMPGGAGAPGMPGGAGAPGGRGRPGASGRPGSSGAPGQQGSRGVQGPSGGRGQPGARPVNGNGYNYQGQSTNGYHQNYQYTGRGDQGMPTEDQIPKHPRNQTEVTEVVREFVLYNHPRCKTTVDHRALMNDLTKVGKVSFMILVDLEDSIYCIVHA